MTVKLTYHTKDAECVLKRDGYKVVLDEMDCDALLRVNEYAVDPLYDVAEFFTDAEGMPDHIARTMAQEFIDQADRIAKHVYAD